MNRKSILITGAAGALGSAWARSLRSTLPDSELHLADINEDKLKQIARETGAIRLIVGDIFEADSLAQNEVTLSNEDVVIWNAALNLDESEPASERLTSRNRQNVALQHRLHSLVHGTRQKLLILVNSVVTKFGKNPKTSGFLAAAAAEKNWHYGAMKVEQSDMVELHDLALKIAGVQNSILYPGSFKSSFTKVEQALGLANALGKKMKGYEEREDWKQPRAFESREITDAVAKLVYHWNQHGTVPEKAKKWVMLNDEDLKL